MSLTVELPAETEALARAANPDLGAYAREAVAVQLFRDGTLSHYDLGQALGLDRFETDTLLKRYRVTEHSLTHADVDADVKSINELLGPPR